MEPVRLVIWDLDGVFWHGTLAEEGARPRPETREIVAELARRGIMSAICSKNDFARAEAELRAQGVWDYFIFPSIDWTPKGARIAALVQAVQLRPESVLFIDDEPANLAEARHCLPSLQVAGQELISSLLYHPLFAGKPDPGLARLAHYKTLQQRHGAAAQAGGDNHAFLRESGIELRIEHDIEPHIGRAVELINRTNQLNFTKNRLPEDESQARMELRRLITQFDTLPGLVSLRDRYGDYGFIGFFCVTGRGDTARLRHFCFSCRVLNLGVEHFIYRLLGRPKIAAVDETVEALPAGPPEIDWITLSGGGITGQEAPSRPKRIDRLVVRGSCNLDALSHYLAPLAHEVRRELNPARLGRQFRIDTSMLFGKIFNPPAPAVKAALESLGYIERDWISAMAQPVAPGSRNVWVLGFWADAYLYFYKHKQLDITIPFLAEGDGHAVSDVNFLPPEHVASYFTHAPNRAAYEALKENFWGVGPAFEDIMRPVLETLAVAARDKAHVIIILPPEHWRGLNDDRPHPRQAEIRFNRLVRDILGAQPGISLVEFGAFIPENAAYETELHYDRLVYARVAAHVIGLIEAHFPP